MLAHALNFTFENVVILLNSNVLRILVGLHKCVCGSLVDSKGLHWLSCRKSARSLPKLAELNSIINKNLASAAISAFLEPGLCRSYGKRISGMSIILWKKGKFLIWDFTCTDHFASTNSRKWLVLYRKSSYGEEKLLHRAN